VIVLDDVRRWSDTYAACRAGREPAEALPSPLRRRLFAALRRDGLDVREIAAHTRTTEYTVGRMLGQAAA
jgi:predicted hotdog family 3-hydroxylacyl-ACP dehydratase